MGLFSLSYISMGTKFLVQLSLGVTMTSRYGKSLRAMDTMFTLLKVMILWQCTRLLPKHWIHAMQKFAPTRKRHATMASPKFPNGLPSSYVVQRDGLAQKR